MANLCQRARLLFIKIALIAINLAILMFLLQSFHHPSEDDNKSQLANTLKSEPAIDANAADIGLYSIETVLITGILLITYVIIVIKEHLIGTIIFAVINTLLALLSIGSVWQALSMTIISACLSWWLAIELYYVHGKVIVCKQIKTCRDFINQER